jgi:hypothetical protein
MELRSLQPPKADDASVLELMPYNQTRRVDAVGACRRIGRLVHHRRFMPTTDRENTNKGDLLMIGDQLTVSMTACGVVGAELRFYKGVLDPLHIAFCMCAAIFSAFPVRRGRVACCVVDVKRAVTGPLDAGG